MILVDTNVLVDIITADANWGEWSLETLNTALAVGPVLINDIVYAELATRYESVAALDAFLALGPLDREATPDEALFLAGHAHNMYRRAGGTRTGVLSDFFIGAHALVAGIPLLTRDVRRYRTYFPTIRLIDPGLN